MKRNAWLPLACEDEDRLNYLIGLPLTTVVNPPTLNIILPKLTAQLSPHTESPRLDAQVLLAHICRQTRTWILAHPEYTLSVGEHRHLEEALGQLLTGMPLPYVIGEWEFYTLSFIVTPDVLIPRPETELLVETALKWLTENPTRRAAADVGTGSGCIAVALATQITDLNITAMDISSAAVEVARQNSIRHKVSERVTLIESDLLSNTSEKFDLICANLPYIPSDTLRILDVYKREPPLALDGGPDGLELIRRILDQAAPLLNPGGLILLEIEAGQRESAIAAALNSFPAAEVTVKSDLAGFPRLAMIQK